MAKSVVLLSGGLDSAVTLAKVLVAARALGDQVIPVAFDYEQRHAKELSSAYALVEYYQAFDSELLSPLMLVSVRGLSLPTSALTSKDVQVPLTGVDPAGIPVTYVPARNSMFLAIATGIAEAAGAGSVWAGYNEVDYSGYPDCRPEFVEAMEAALALGTKRGVEGAPIRIKAPLIGMSKKDIVGLGLRLGVPFNKTWSCYVGEQKPCGRCDSCRIRIAAFKEHGMEDPCL